MPSFLWTESNSTQYQLKNERAAELSIRWCYCLNSHFVDLYRAEQFKNFKIFRSDDKIIETNLFDNDFFIGLLMETDFGSCGNDIIQENSNFQPEVENSCIRKKKVSRW